VALAVFSSDVLSLVGYATEEVFLVLLLHAFASGCTAQAI
jgi:hypothetical protein